MPKKPCAALLVNQVRVGALGFGSPGQRVTVGVDIGKHSVFAVARAANGQVERPWQVANPTQLGVFVGLLRELAQHPEVVVALEPTGTYGDPRRRSKNWPTGSIVWRVRGGWSS